MGLAIQEAVPSEATSSTETVDNGFEGEDRTEAIKRQVEYYFSRQNLMQDTFLLSKMDKDHYVDVFIIAQFKMMKQLTTDVDLILKCVKGSDKVIIDEEKKRIKPAGTMERTTLILRNIPTSASEESVKALLATVEIKDFVSLRADVGDNWFISFETEETTKAAMARAKALKWEGKQIGCAIKSESLLKGLTFLPPTALQYHASVPYANTHNNYSNNYSSFGGRRANGGGGGGVGRRNPGENEADVHARRSPGGNKKSNRSERAGQKDAAGDTGSHKAQDKPIIQLPPPTLSDFPALGGGASGEGPAAMSSAAADAISAASTPPQCSTPPLSSGAASPTAAVDSAAVTPLAGTPQKAKLSYAQMALASLGTGTAAGAVVKAS